MATRKASKLWHTARQATRYKYEKKELKKKFGDCVKFYEEAGFVRVEVQASTNKLGNNYTLRCYLPDNFPSSCPSLVVSRPDSPLKGFNGNILGVSHENHCLGTHRFGLTEICHCRPDCWDNNMNLCEVFMKGLKWLEAYEIMITTGENIDTFLAEMPISQEKLEKIKRARKHLERELAEVQLSEANSFQRFVLEVSLCLTIDLLMQQECSEGDSNQELSEALIQERQALQL